MTQALGDPVADIVESLGRLDIDVQSAVPSYLGMTVTISAADDPAHHPDRASPQSRYTFTALRSRVQSAEARASLVVPLPGASVLLYAAAPGAFVDLAADLAWLSGRRLSDYALDTRLTPLESADASTPLSSISTINQAIGVLIGRGRTRDEAHAELEALARATATDSLGAARALLASLAASE